MKNYRLLLVFLLSAVSSVSYSQSADRGKITTFFASGSGAVAIQIDSAFLNANTSGECPTASDSAYAGVASSVDPILKSTILAAKTMGRDVTVIIAGCEVGGGWYKIQDIYVH